jgi:methyl-accepting chemotaxis protein WspA
MKNRTVKQYIVLGFSTVLLIMVTLSAFAFVLLYEIRGQVTSVTTDTWPGLYFSSQIESLSVETVGSVYKHVLSSDPFEERQLEAEITANQSKLDDASREYEKTIVNVQDRQLFTSMVNARNTCQAAYKPVLELSRNAKASEAQMLLHQQVDQACMESQRATQAEVQDNKRLGEESNQGILNAVSRAELAVVLGLALGVILTGVSGFLLVQAINRLVGQVQESGLKVSTSSTEIAATSQEQLSTANEIAATTSEIGATAKQISVTSKELVLTMREVAEVAERTTTLANSGQAGLGRMKVTVQQIVEASGSITDRLAVLNEKAGNIGTVVTTITKVADQTNLLSLNAAIEAEKAGEYGRGFAVVATEIRRLADQTAVSTSDIEQTVKEIQSAVAAGVMGMDKFSEEVRRGVEVVQQVSEELSQIIQQVQTLTPSFETVSEGMQSQSLGAQQISDALSQLSEAATQTVGSLRQSNVAVEQLNEAARGLQNGVSRFARQGETSLAGVSK